MSDMWMPCHPRIDEPSNPTPSLNVPSSHVSIGYEQCCHDPRKSMNFRSTISALCFFAKSKNCLAFMVASCVGGTDRRGRGGQRTVRPPRQQGTSRSARGSRRRKCAQVLPERLQLHVGHVTRIREDAVHGREKRAAVRLR